MGLEFDLIGAYTVYLDQVFLGNLVMNYTTLWAAAKLSRSPVSRIRLAAGAALGALYSLSLFVPENTFLLSIWFKGTASALIIAATFAPLPPKKFLACLGSFYLTSFILGGLIFGVIFFIHSGQVTSYNGIGIVIAQNYWPGIFLGLLAFWVAVRGFAALMKKGFFENFFKMSIVIKSGGEQIEVQALLDTGNQLEDPLTKNPVIVVEYNIMKTFLPLEIQGYFEKNGEPDVWQILGSLCDNSCALRFSAVPFQSLGRAKGLMLGFRPDEVIIDRRGQQVRAGKVVIAIYHKNLDPGGAYRALLSPNLLEKAS